MASPGFCCVACVACLGSLGLGTVYVGLFDSKKAESVLAVPQGFTVVTMTPLGYPEHTPRPTSRKELSEVVSHERFGGS